MTSLPPDAGTTSVPLCPRHPDRVAYVRCQRCGRPACPECQRVAPVGVQCVDCVAATAAATAPRSAFGARLRPGRPVVTFTLIGLCVVSYVLQLALGWSAWTEVLAFSPAAGQVQPYRFLTAAFLHSTSSVLHILFNMYALFVVGPFLEQMFGRARFAALFLVSAVGGSVGYLLFADPATQQWYTAVLGASGAVFGLFGATLVVLRRLGRNATQFVVVIALNVVIGFVVPGIAWQAHLGGLVVGVLLGAAYAFAPRRSRTAVSVVATTAVVLLLALTALLTYAAL